LVASSHGSCDKDVPINVKRVTTRILLVVYHMHVFLGQGFPAKFLNSQKNTTNALTPIILHCTVLVLQVFCFCFAGLLVQNNLKLENYRIEHGPRRFILAVSCVKSSGLNRRKILQYLLWFWPKFRRILLDISLQVFLLVLL